MHPLLYAIILSLIPVFELRGGIPVAMAQGASPFTAFLACTLANMLVAPIVFFFLEFVHHRLLPIKFYRKTFDWFLERARKKARKTLEKYGYIGLAIFVAIPLPGTGAYTGSLVAWFFGMKPGKSIAWINAGVLVAGIIVTMVLTAGWHAFGLS
jgi:uncharacterized membrane protein